jgi:hypothetical protein
MHKAAAKTEKESNMRSDTLESILKDCGPVSLCKAIVDRGRSPCDESELVAALSKFAADASGEARDVAFAKLYEGDVMVREAIGIAKSAPFAGMVLDYMPHVVAAEAFQPQVISGGDWRDEDDRQQAWEALADIGRRMAPTATPERQWALAFEDPKNISLANRVHRRPTAPAGGVYAFPTAAAANDFGVPTAETAYAALMTKAREYQTAHPELTESQAFEKVYTDRANVELAKRERVESAPR